MIGYISSNHGTCSTKNKSTGKSTAGSVECLVYLQYSCYVVVKIYPWFNFFLTGFNFIAIVPDYGINKYMTKENKN